MEGVTTEQSRRILIALNPTAGGRCRIPLVRRLAELLEAVGLQAEVITEIGTLAEKADRLYGNGDLRAVVAAGGDGTVGLVAQRTMPGVPIAVLPLGTENLLARQLGLRADPAELCAAICGGRIVRLDAGLAAGRLFLLMVGCGFDAEVVRRLHGMRRGHIRHFSYTKPILDSLRNYQYPELRVYCESPVSTGKGDELVGAACPTDFSARWAFVVNLPRYAVGLQIAPDALGTDGFLDICLFKEGSLWSGLRYLAGVALGTHLSWRDVTRFRARCVRIESTGAVPYQLDGDPGGFLPVTIEILPGRLTVLVPTVPCVESRVC